MMHSNPENSLKRTAGLNSGLTPEGAETAARHVQMREELQRSRKATKQPKGKKRIKSAMTDLDQFQQESLILAQDERWRRA